MSSLGLEVEDIIDLMLEHGVKRIKIKDVEVELSDYALVRKYSEDMSQIEPKSASRQTEEKDTSKALVDTDEMSEKEYEELLNWSAT